MMFTQSHVVLLTFYCCMSHFYFTTHHASQKQIAVSKIFMFVFRGVIILSIW